MGLVEIEKMSTTERLQTMEKLWGLLCNEAKDLSSPEWHKNILEERKQRVDSNKGQFLTLEEVRKRFHQ